MVPDAIHAFEVDNMIRQRTLSGKSASLRLFLGDEDIMQEGDYAFLDGQKTSVKLLS